MSLANVAKKISDEVGCDMTMARQMAEQLTKAHEDLRPVISDWLRGELTGFEFNGVTLDAIMKKEHVPYIKAIFSMNVMLNDPQFAAVYSDMKFSADDMEE